MNERFLDYFGDEQYYLFVNGYIRKMCKVGGVRFDVMDYYKIYQPQDRPKRRVVLRIIQKIHFYVALLKTITRG